MIKYLAKVIIELESPLSIASGLESSYSDMQVRRDWNDLPVIPATSLKGVLKSLASTELLEFLGKDDKSGNLGSSLVVSDALLQNSQGNVYTTLQNSVFEDDLLKHYKILPNREHVCINHLGVTDGKGKFTNSIVYKGSRFQLQLKLEVDKSQDEIWEELLSLFYRSYFLIGSQVTNGFGRIKPIKIRYRKYNLTKEKDLQAFCLHTPYAKINEVRVFTNDVSTSTYELFETFQFTTDAIHVGVGFGDDEVNATNLIEKVIQWDSEEKFVGYNINYTIPAASIKGVLRHRTFYYLCPELDWEHNPKPLEDYKKKQTKTIQDIESLFGSKTEENQGQIGNVLIEDISIDPKHIEETAFQHNSIDRFTSGTIDKALYAEKVYAINVPVTLKIWLTNRNTIEEHVLEAFEKAIEDLKQGRLALGGNTTNGNGFLKEISNE